MHDTLRPRRRDALPEYTQYADNGCQLYHACLECPFENCQFDGGGGPSGVRRRTRNSALVTAASSEGVNAGDLANMFGLSRRTVFRVLRQYERGR